MLWDNACCISCKTSYSIWWSRSSSLNGIISNMLSVPQTLLMWSCILMMNSLINVWRNACWRITFYWRPWRSSWQLVLHSQIAWKGLLFLGTANPNPLKIAATTFIFQLVDECVWRFVLPNCLSAASLALWVSDSLLCRRLLSMPLLWAPINTLLAWSRSMALRLMIDWSSLCDSW